MKCPAIEEGLAFELKYSRNAPTALLPVTDGLDEPA